MNGSSVGSQIIGLLRIARDEPARQSSVLEEEVVNLFTQHRTPLLRYLLSMGLSVHDGEEVVQEVFLALFQHLQRGKPRTNLNGWIFTVGHNLAIKQRMRTNQQARLHSDEQLAESRVDPSSNPEEQVVLAERQRQLLAVVDILPEADRCCLRLRSEGLRYRQISAILGISLGAVSLSLGRSLKRLISVDES